MNRFVRISLIGLQYIGKSHMEEICNMLLQMFGMFFTKSLFSIYVMTFYKQRNKLTRQYFLLQAKQRWNNLSLTYMSLG